MAERRTLGKAPDPVAVLRAHRSSVNALAFHPSNRLLSGDAEGELKIWDVGRRRVVSSSRVHTPAAGVVGIGVSDYWDDKVLSQGRDGTVKCWKLLNDGLSREPLVHFSTNSYHFCKLSPLSKSTVPGISEIGPESQDISGPEVPSDQGISCGSSLVAVAGEEAGVAEIWDVDSGTRVQRLCDSKNPGMCMALQLFTPPGAQATFSLIAGYEDGSMALWDLRTIKSPCFSSRFHQEPVLSVCVDASCRSGISGAADNKTVFFELDQPGSCALKKEIEHGRPGISDVAVRSDGRICATGGWDHRVRVYDYLRVRPLAILKYHSSTVTGVVFSKDNKILASSSRDSCIALWSIYPAT